MVWNCIRPEGMALRDGCVVMVGSVVMVGEAEGTVEMDGWPVGEDVVGEEEMVGELVSSSAWTVVATRRVARTVGI